MRNVTTCIGPTRVDRHARINLGIRRRLAPLLRNDRRRTELMFALLFSLPGTPVIYYGDEIGMGDNIYVGDRNGVRTPMQWSADRNAGFSRANPQKLYLPIIIDPEYHYETVNVEAQQGNPSSLLWWVKRLVALRKTFRAFGRGSFRLLRPDNTKVLAFIREYQDERVLMVANLSRFVQYVLLDLKDYAGVIPEEVLGRTRFPQVTDEPYLLTLGPHAFIWFSLPVPVAPIDAKAGPHGLDEVELPLLRGKRPLPKRFQPENWDELEALLPQYLHRNRLLSSRTAISSCEIVHVAPIRVGEIEVWYLIVRVDPRGGISETISLVLAFVPEDQIEQLLVPPEIAGFARVSGPEPGVLCDALAVPACCRGLLRGILAGRIATGCRRRDPGGDHSRPDRDRAGRPGGSPAVAPSQRAHQHGRRLRRILHPQDVPSDRGRRQPGSRNRPLPGRSAGLSRGDTGRRLHGIPAPRGRTDHTRRPSPLCPQPGHRLAIHARSIEPVLRESGGPLARTTPQTLAPWPRKGSQDHGLARPNTRAN